MASNNLILPVIVIAQFMCTSLWFAGNGVMPDLVANYDLSASALGHLTAAVQFGFITGTLVFALMMIADRYSPSKVFFGSAVLAAVGNAGMIWSGNGIETLLLFRFFTGFLLAGIYPVGMKIAADYFEKGLGKSLSLLVGALVIGTAFPHLLKNLSTGISWTFVVLLTSGLSVLGGSMIYFLVPDGPFRKPGQQIKLDVFFQIFRNKQFRSAAFGYFGHMWELYTFWAFVPVMLFTYQRLHPGLEINIPIYSFSIIAIGGLACVLGGLIHQKVGTKRTAFLALLLSGICCLFSPIIFQFSSVSLFLAYLFFWGMVVIADSPLFSTLVAQNANPELKGSALTIVNCIGFAITIVSIQLVNQLQYMIDPTQVYVILAIGPVLGLIALIRE